MRETQNRTAAFDWRAALDVWRPREPDLECAYTKKTKASRVSTNKRGGVAGKKLRLIVTIRTAPDLARWRNDATVVNIGNKQVVTAKLTGLGVPRKTKNR